jgi:hypothetical protein
MAEPGLADVVAKLLDGIDYDDPAGIEATASQIRAHMGDASTPPSIEYDIRAAYDALEARLGADVAVSVRSSATAEDLPGMSFAGQQDTYLFISGADAVLDAVRRCWASLWTDRAIAYRHAQGFDHQSVYLAVVVQQMFPSAVSGVLFTANPVTSNPDQFFVNAGWGLGEAIVSGRVNPDQLVVAKGSLEIVDRDINDKVVMTVADPGGQGSIEVPVDDDARTVQALPDDAVRELCRIGQAIEDHYGFPQDIEWGWAGGRFAILQAREVTGADLDYAEGLELWKTPAARASMYDERWVWSRAYSDEVQTGPSTPSFYTYLQRGMTHLKHMLVQLTGVDELVGYAPEEFLDFPSYRWYGARAYYNLALERERIRRWIPPVRPRRRRAVAVPRHRTRRDPGDAVRLGRVLRGCSAASRGHQPRRLAHREHAGRLREPRTLDRRGGGLLDRPRPSTPCRSRRSSGPSWRPVATPASARTSPCPSRSTCTCCPRRCRPRALTWLGDSRRRRLQPPRRRPADQDRRGEHRAVGPGAHGARLPGAPWPSCGSTADDEVMAPCSPAPRPGTSVRRRPRRLRRPLRPPRRGRTRRLPPPLARRPGAGAGIAAAHGRPRRRGLARGTTSTANVAAMLDSQGGVRRDVFAGRRPRCRADGRHGLAGRHVRADRADALPIGRRRFDLARRPGAGLVLLPRLRALLQRQDHVAVAPPLRGDRPALRRDRCCSPTRTTCSSSAARRCSWPTPAG